MASIAIVAPVRPRSTSGNDVTAARWAELLEAAGHRAVVVPLDESATECPAAVAEVLAASDVLLALHARRSAVAVRWWREQPEHRPLVVALAGTDLYGDLPDDVSARASLDAADAVIVLQSEAIPRLTAMSVEWGERAVVIHQSSAGPHPDRATAEGEVRIVVLAHLRPVKDPLLCARATRLLPAGSRVVIHHAGGGMDPDLVAQARREVDENPRYRWYDELDAVAARTLLSTAHALACTSLSEGGANVVTEAIALGVPVIGTHIDGNIGLLGRDHPGLVPVGDEQAMADLLDRLETDSTLLADLQRRTDDRRHLTDPATEQAALSTLIASLFAP